MADELTLEKVRVVERLTAVEIGIQRLVEIKQQMHQENLERFTKLDVALHGNGRDGLLVEMGKVKQAIVLIIWAQGLTWATIVAWAIHAALQGVHG